MNKTKEYVKRCLCGQQVKIEVQGSYRGYAICGCGIKWIVLTLKSGKLMYLWGRNA